MSGAEWTEAHQREATVCLLEIARNAALRGDRATMLKAARCAALSDMGDEGSFRRRLSGLLDPRVVRREVRRVRRLAEGRLVRETKAVVSGRDACRCHGCGGAIAEGARRWERKSDGCEFCGDCLSDARDEAAENEDRVTLMRTVTRRVTRIRRAP